MSGTPLEDAITYQLHIQLSRDCTARIGRLGQFTFPAGRYVYTGSARRNLAARVRRHLSSTKALRWHIDYLLAQQAAKVVRVRLSDDVECKLNQKVRGKILVKGFGASDCRSGCGSHLKYQGQHL